MNIGSCLKIEHCLKNIGPYVKNNAPCLKNIGAYLQNIGVYRYNIERYLYAKNKGFIKNFQEYIEDRTYI